MRKIEHLGIAVKDLETATKTYEALLGKPAYQTEEVESEGVKTVFFKTKNMNIALIIGSMTGLCIFLYLAIGSVVKWKVLN